MSYFDAAKVRELYGIAQRPGSGLRAIRIRGENNTLVNNKLQLWLEGILKF